MLLALDIGNSTIGVAVFDGKKRLADLTIPHPTQRNSEEAWSAVQTFLSHHSISSNRIHGTCISSVVPSFTSVFTTFCNEKLDIEPLTISGSLDLGIKIHYEDPSSLGPDRICAAIAGFHRFGGPLIIIDFGTATTYGVIDKNGDFLGGVISLGVNSMAEALSQRTAQLPKIDLQLPLTAICTNTLSAMQAGTLFSAVDAVEGMVKRMRKELKVEARVIATGGLSVLMSQQTNIIHAVEPWLVLEGARLIYERTRS